VEYLIGYEGNAFASTGNVADDLLSITAVHPMREEAVERVLERAGANWSAVDTLARSEKLTATEYNGHRYFMRRLPRRRRRWASHVPPSVKALQTEDQALLLTWRSAGGRMLE